MPTQTALVAMLVAVTAGYSMIRHARRMLTTGVALEEGGGWTALVLVEFMVAIGAAGMALT